MTRNGKLLVIIIINILQLFRLLELVRNMAPILGIKEHTPVHLEYKECSDSNFDITFMHSATDYIQQIDVLIESNMYSLELAIIYCIEV